MNNSALGVLFYIIFIPVFLATLILGPHREGTSWIWYFVKKATLSLVITIAALVGIGMYASANGI